MTHGKRREHAQKSEECFGAINSANHVRFRRVIWDVYQVDFSVNSEVPLAAEPDRVITGQDGTELRLGKGYVAAWRGPTDEQSDAIAH